MRADLAAARTAAQDARAAQMAAERKRAIHDAQVVQAKAAIAATTAGKEKAKRDWEAARAQAVKFTSCPEGLPETPDDDRGAIEAAQLRINAAQEAEAEAQDKLGRKRKDLVDMAARRDILREDLKAKATDREALTIAKADADSAPIIILNMSSSRLTPLQLAGGNKELVKELRALLLKELPSHQEHLQNSYVRKDLEALANHAHKLHGSAAYCGVPRLKECVAKLEREARQHHHELIPLALNNTLSAIQELLHVGK